MACLLVAAKHQLIPFACCLFVAVIFKKQCLFRCGGRSVEVLVQKPYKFLLVQIVFLKRVLYVVADASAHDVAELK